MLVENTLAIGVSTKKLTKSKSQSSWMKGTTRRNNERMEKMER